MLVFVIPLKGREVSASWTKTCQLLERTLRSICRQTDQNFKVIVVHGTKPEIQFEHSSIDYLAVDFDIPSGLPEKRIDKSKKIIQGILYARKFMPSHIMVVDADDCISRNLSKYVNNHPDSDGWVLNSGYVYSEYSRFVYYRKSHFYSWCGSCNIVKFEACPLPDRNDVDFADSLIQYYSGDNHANIREHLRKQGYLLEPLPFVGAVYIIGNGENIYQKGFSTLHNANKGKPIFFMKELLKFRPLTPSIRAEFGLYQLLPKSLAK